MPTTVLVILHEAHRLLTVFESHTAAWAALRQFVDDRWPSHLPTAPNALSDEERIATFFAGDSQYLLASVELEIGGLEAGGLDPPQGSEQENNVTLKVRPSAR